MITPESPTTKYFSAAVAQIISRSGHGAQSSLARQAHVSISYLNDLLAGRKQYWPDAVKERIAQVCGYSVAELLEIGEHYVLEGLFWPHGRKVTHTAARSMDRMARIYQLACDDAGLKKCNILFTPETVPLIAIKLSAAYRAGSLSDARLYSEALEFCRSILGVESNQNK